MALETTLNINSIVLKQITIVAKRSGISRSAVIVYLLKKIMEDIPDPDRLGKMVQYQERRPRGDWHVFHLKLREDEYEYFMDLRKLLKMSVSLILAFAVKKLLHLTAKKIITDNYTYKNYVLIREMIGNIISWRIFWGFPHNIENLLPRVT